MDMTSYLTLRNWWLGGQ